MKLNYLFFISALCLIGFLSSCQQEEFKYSLELKVTVQDTIAAQNVLVYVYTPVEGSIIDDFYYTNEEGMVFLEFENKVVIEYEVTKQPYKSCGFVALEEGLNTKTIDLKLFDDEENGCRQSN